MVQKPITPSAEKAALLDQLQSSRTDLHKGVNRLRQDLNVSTKLKKSVAHNPGSWLSVAAMGGVILSLLPKSGRKRKPSRWRKRRNSNVEQSQLASKTSSSLLVTLFKLLLPIFKPALTAYATKTVASYVKDR